MFKYFVIFLLINVPNAILQPINETEAIVDSSVAVNPSSIPVESTDEVVVQSTEATVVITSSTAIPVTPKITTTTTTSAPAVESSTARRLISFDQRQEGQYNIRADLENFVFLVVPSNSASSLSLLDLLSKSAYKKSHAKHASHKKHSVKSATGGANKNIEPIVSHHHHHHHDVKPHEQHDVEQFVEGRTPYKVDISSIDTSPETHLDVLPSPSSSSYPIHLGRSISGPLKPITFAFDDNTPIGSVIPIKGNFLRKFRSYPISNYYIPVSPVLVTVVDHNRDTLLNHNMPSDRKTKTIYNSDGGNARGDPNNNNNNFNSILLTTSDSDNDRNNDDDSFDSLINYNQKKLSPLDQRQQELDSGWKLLGATEQCGPDGYRDSYGVCQFYNLD